MRRSCAVVLLALLTACARVDTPPYGGELERGLVEATAADDLAAVERQLALGANPNKMATFRGNNNSAWWVALHLLRPKDRQRAAIVRALLKAGANPDAAWGYSALGELDENRRLRAGRTPGTFDNVPLEEALMYPDPQVVRAILEVKPTARGRETILAMAIEQGETEIVHLLVEAGTDVNNHYGGVTPLVAAINQRDEAMMTYLEQHGAREKPTRP